MFPGAVIRRITEILSSKLGIGGSKELSLTEIQGIDLYLVQFLNDEGVWTILDLSVQNPELLGARIHHHKNVIENWQSQAKLLVELGNEMLINHFHRIGINDWDDLAVLLTIDDELKPDDLTKVCSDNEISPVIFHVLREKIQTNLLPSTADK